MRPGNLAGHKGFTPRRNRGFGGDKSDFEPPPGPPPAGSTEGTVVLSDAYNKNTKTYYAQHPKCPQGEWMPTCDQATHSPVAGCGPVSECCDIILGPPFCAQDCDPPSPTGACDDDPNYVEFPEGAWASCAEAIAAFTAKGIPESFAKTYCENEDIGGVAKKTTSAPKPSQQKAAAPPKPTTNRPPLSLAFTGSCPRTHHKEADALGVFCKPCPPGTLFHGGSCKPKPPPCPCNLKRQGDPDFGACPPPPKGCGPPPQAQKCNVAGHGLMNPVCKCGKWQCPTNKDVLIAKFKSQGKAIPKGIAGFGNTSYKKPLIGLAVFGAAVAGYFLFIK